MNALRTARRLSLCAALATAVTSLAAVPAPVVADPVANAEAPVLGVPAPAFTARRLQGGSPVANSDYTGKVLVVNFWATWCPPCRAETPDMIRAYRALAGKDVAFLGVDTTEVAPVIKTFLSAKGVPYPIALAGPDMYNGFAVAYIPTTVVIDPHGIVRARWTGELAPGRLAQFVAAAKAEKNYVLDTPDQGVLERLLDPASFNFTGDATVTAIEVARLKSTLAAADRFANLHADPSDTTVDFGRLQTLEGTLLAAAAKQSTATATTDRDRVAADRLTASADGKLNRFADAVAALQNARTLAPSDASLSLDIAKADYRLHDYPDGIAAATQYTASAPQDADGWNWLGLLNQRSTKFADAAVAYEKTIPLLVGAVNATTTPDDRVDAIANVADTSLDLANVYVALGDVAGTQRAFATANAYAAKLDPKGQYADLYRNVHERTQEGSIAVRMAHGGSATALSIAPWTGADLPGSLASTLKYRLIVASTPNHSVDLSALGLHPGWVASFCADGLCSPNRVHFTLPDSGVKTYEFQLVPPGRSNAAGNVKIRASDGTSAAVPARG